MVVGESVERRMEIIVGERVSLELRWNFFTVRVEKAWNALPESVNMQRTVNAFKNEHDSWRKWTGTVCGTEDEQQTTSKVEAKHV